MRWYLVFPLLLAVLAPPVATAWAGDEKPPVEDVIVEREAVAEIAGASVPYRTRTGTFVLRTEEGKPKATVFHTAYLRSDVEDTASRPLTFVFNGGPGSSSVWLHLGLFGPKRVDLGAEGFDSAPPHTVVPNPHSLLDVTDLVFVDPVTTGYSRPAEGESPAQFHGVREDVRWVAEFIRLYTTRGKRWGSPKFLAGESYGTTRAAALTGELQQRHGMDLNGVLLISSILQFQTARFDTGNDLPYVVFLPTYTATAHYHGKLDEELSRDLKKTLAEVEEFALGEYATALLLGDRIDAERRAAVAEKLARYTGLSTEYVESTNLRIRIGRFVKELRRSERVTVGRLDSRYKGRDRDAASSGYEYDPSYAAIQGPYTSALNAYVREELGFESDLPYEILTGRVHPWSYDNAKNRYLDVSETLRGAMNRNRSLRVFVASGYYDLATPYFATQHTLAQMQLDAELRKNVTVEHFEAGHMMYIREASLVRLRAALVAFYAGATPRPR